MQKQQDGLRDVEWKCVKKIKLLNIHPSDYIQVNYEMISELNLDIGQGWNGPFKPLNHVQYNLFYYSVKWIFI